MLERDKIMKYLILNKTAKTTELMRLLKINEKTFYHGIEYFENAKMIEYDKENHILRLYGYRQVNEEINNAITRILSNGMFFVDRLDLPYLMRNYNMKKKGSPVLLWKVIEHYNVTEPVSYNRKERLLDLVSNMIGKSKEKIREDFDRAFSSFMLYLYDEEDDTDE